MDEWIPIDEFLEYTNTSRSKLNYRIRKKQWHDGYVIKKHKGSFYYTHGNLTHYYKWDKEVFSVAKKRLKKAKS